MCMPAYAKLLAMDAPDAAVVFCITLNVASATRYEIL